MLDLNDDPPPAHIPPHVRPGASLDLIRGWPNRRADRDDDERDDDPAASPVQSLLAAALTLFDGLLVGMVADTAVVVRALLALAQREATRLRDDSRRAPRRHDDEPGLPVEATSPALRAAVQGVIEQHAVADVPAETVDRAVMGVAFVAGIEAEHAGTLAPLVDA